MRMELLVSVLLASLFGVIATKAHSESSAAAVVALEARDGGVTVTGKAIAFTAGDYNASMMISKSGPSGITKTIQSGSFELEAGASAEIGTLGLSFSAGDNLSVTVEVTQDGVLLSRAVSETGR